MVVFFFFYFLGYLSLKDTARIQGDSPPSVNLILLVSQVMSLENWSSVFPITVVAPSISQVILFVFGLSEAWMCLDRVSSLLYLLSFILFNILWALWVCGLCWTSTRRGFSLFHLMWLLSLFLSPSGILTHEMSFVAVPLVFFWGGAILFYFCLFFSVLSIWDVSCFLQAQTLSLPVFYLVCTEPIQGASVSFWISVGVCFQQPLVLYAVYLFR